jgi:ATP-dependent Clp protease ATP-binding subunit ClpA
MGIELSVDEETLELLIRKGITKALGARPMKRTAQKYIGDAIRMALKDGNLKSGDIRVSPEMSHLWLI